MSIITTHSTNPFIVNLNNTTSAHVSIHLSTTFIINNNNNRPNNRRAFVVRQYIYAKMSSSAVYELNMQQNNES